MTSPFEFFRSPITLKSATPGTTVNGIWVPGAYTSSTITSSIQPLKGKEMECLPEGRRLSEAFKMYTSSVLRTVGVSGSNLNCDRVVFNGEEFDVWELMPWQNNLNFAIVNHYKYLILRVNT